MYRLLDLVDDPVLQRKLAHDNFDALISRVPATKTQLEALKSKGIAPAAGKTLTKLEAGKLLADSKSLR
ncbi:hypothetical protein D3C75_1285310 [compost metagenome]